MVKVNLTKEQILDAQKTSKNVEEMLEKLHVTYGVLYARCKEYDIMLKTLFRKYHINKEEFMSLYNQGLNDVQIGEKLGISSKRIQQYRADNNIPKYVNREITLTPEQYQVFLGGMYGDSYMGQTSNNTNYYICFAHSLAQEKYCL